MFFLLVCSASDVWAISDVFLEQDVKNEAETYMLKELSLLKWQEKATKMSFEDTVAKIFEQKESLQSLEDSLKNER